MICEGSGFPEGDSANAPDFITGRLHDRTYAKIIIILENYTVNHTASPCQLYPSDRMPEPWDPLQVNLSKAKNQTDFNNSDTEKVPI